MVEMNEVLSVRLDDDLRKKLHLLLEKRKIVDKSAYVRRLLAKSLLADLFDYLADEVRAKRMSMWKAAEIAGVSLREIMVEMARREVPVYDESSFIKDIEFVRGL